MTLAQMPSELASERLILTREELADAGWLGDLFTARSGAPSPKPTLAHASAASATGRAHLGDRAARERGIHSRG